MLKDAIFVSEWDGGTKLATPCTVDVETKTIYNIGLIDMSSVCCLDREYVIIDGEEYTAGERSEDGVEYRY